MGNESGEWIMHGMKWDNPDCIHSVDEAIDVYKRQDRSKPYRNRRSSSM